MSDGAVFECFSCHGTFAGFGISVGSVDASLGAPGDLAAGAFCDACVATWQPVTATAPPVTATSRHEARDGESTHPAVLSAVEASVALRACDECGEPFEAARADARYCSGTCRMRAHRRRRELALPVIDETKE
jgi:hypothetical protein